MSDFENRMMKEMRSVSADTEARDAFEMGAEWGYDEAQEEIESLKAEIYEYWEALKFYAEDWEIGQLDDEMSVRKIGSYDAFVEVHKKAREVIKKYEVKE